eukprot:SAG22_NODE_991_length_6129_cov_8.370813_5_plen_184_part_00
MAVEDSRQVELSMLYFIFFICWHSSALPGSGTSRESPKTCLVSRRADCHQQQSSAVIITIIIIIINQPASEGSAKLAEDACPERAHHAGHLGRPVLEPSLVLQPMAWHGTARHGMAWHGMARHGTARHGTARHGTARHGTARHGTARYGTARHNMADTTKSSSVSIEQNRTEQNSRTATKRLQ